MFVDILKKKKIKIKIRGTIQLFAEGNDKLLHSNLP